MYSSVPAPVLLVNWRFIWRQRAKYLLPIGGLFIAE
jgi:hypothetical protein